MKKGALDSEKWVRNEVEISERDMWESFGIKR